MTDSVFSALDYIEYQQGSGQIVITIPHGGGLRPSHIPDRDAGSDIGGKVVYIHDACIEKDHRKYSVRYKKDTFTQELGLMLADRLELLTNHRPHVVLCHLYRGKLDVNCELEKAAFGVVEAGAAWHAWHAFIQQAKEEIQETYKRGLLLDIHGHRHPEDWIELGYTLSPTQLNENSYAAEDTSICGLLEVNKLTKSPQKVIQGEHSLGGLLSAQGYKVVPSPQFPSPGNGSYYTGGFNTTYHGSHQGSPVDAIQLENPKSLRNAKAAPSYVEALSLSLVQFMKIYYQQR